MPQTTRRELTRLLLEAFRKSRQDKNKLQYAAMLLELMGKRTARPQLPDTLENITRVLGLEDDGTTGNHT